MQKGICVAIRQRTLVLAGALLTAIILVTAMLIAVQWQAQASSHREAPFISKDAYADNTDVYAFVSPDRQDSVTLIANWIPFEGPEGGPNYFGFDPYAQYHIHVDNDGDARADITYTLSNKLLPINVNTFLYNTGEVTLANNFAALSLPQAYTVTENMANGASTVLVGNRLMSPVNIGSKSTPDYANLETVSTFHTADGAIQIFAGQVDDPFWVDLQVFDLLTLRGQDMPIGYAKGNNIPVDSLSGFNVHTLAIQVPIARLTESDPVIGVWASTSRRTTRIFNSPGVTTHTGDYVQISRLGMPLVNEVVLPLGLKDVFNSIPPATDLVAYSALQRWVEDPEIGRLLCDLYGVSLPGDTNDDCSTEHTPGTPRSGRGDIFDIFLTGIVLTNPFTITTVTGPQTLPAGTNVNRPANVVPAEMLRLNTALAGTTCSPTPSRLGILGGDACGFPNGRRLTDDVIEIELLAVAGAAYGVLDGRDAGFTFDPALIGVLDDGLNTNDVPFRDTFPYMAVANSGQEHIHQNPSLVLFVPSIKKALLSLELASGQGLRRPLTLLLLLTLVAAPAAILARRRL